MASARAFGILNTQNHISGSQPVGKSMQASKSGETRPAAFALKDLTNKSQRTLIHQDDKGKGNSSAHGGKSLNAKTTAIMQKISKDTRKQAPSRKLPQHNNGYDHFAPQNAEYAWGQANCLREDLVDQMLDFPDVSRDLNRKPLLKPARSDLLDLPDLDAPWDCYEPASLRHLDDLVKPLDLPTDDFPLVDIQDLEFMF